ncbi:putative VIER F-box protein 1 [Asimina triloba]
MSESIDEAENRIKNLLEIRLSLSLSLSVLRTAVRRTDAEIHPRRIAFLRPGAHVILPSRRCMGQSASSAANPTAQIRRSNSNPSLRMGSKMKSTVHLVPDELRLTTSPDSEDRAVDHTLDLPDECLAHVFHSLGAADRKRCSLVCRRWLAVEGQSRSRLSLDARGELALSAPAIFSRFDSVSKLALKCDRRSASIDDDALAVISLHCRGLTRLKLRSCRQITHAGMAVLGRSCPGLKKLSVGSCAFGAKGINAVLEHAASLEELSIKRLRGLTDGNTAEPVLPGASADSLKSICLKELLNGQCFAPLIVGTKNLKALKLHRCSGDWDRLLEAVAERGGTGLVVIHLERLQVSDRGLSAISNCSDLEILHLVKTPECTDSGLISVAERCKLLRKLHIDGWKTNRIGDEGLVAIAKRCLNLQELVLIGVNPTTLSLGMLASNCRNLERLALCASETIGDAEISCIAAKCIALRKLCIKGCPVSDHGMEALAGGCPNLMKVKVKKCRGVTCEGADWLRAKRGSLAVNLDTGVVEQQDGSMSDGGGGGVQENGGEHLDVAIGQPAAADLPSSSGGRSAFSKAKMGLLAGRNFMACTIRRWSHSNNNPHSP